MSDKTDDLYLPNAVLTRIIRDSLPERTLISQEARSAISKAASSFILYVTSMSSAHCSASKRKTLLPIDVLAALKEMQFEHFIEELEKYVAIYREQVAAKKASKNSSLTTNTEDVVEVEEADAGQEADDTQQEEDDDVVMIEGEESLPIFGDSDPAGGKVNDE